MKNNKLTASYVKDVLDYMRKYNIGEMKTLSGIIIGCDENGIYSIYYNNIAILSKDKKDFIDSIKDSNIYGMNIV